MGGRFSALIPISFRRKAIRVLIVGLDAAGKTTTLYKLKLGEVVTTIPTIGFNVETVEFKNISFTAWDIGGRGAMRALTRHYYQHTQAIILVVDSNDRDRIEDAREFFLPMLEEDELRDACLLVFANKQDLPNAMNVSEVTEKLGLHQLRQRQWKTQASCATSGDGLYEGLDWLGSTLDRSDTARRNTKCMNALYGGGFAWIKYFQEQAETVATKVKSQGKELLPVS